MRSLKDLLDEGVTQLERTRSLAEVAADRLRELILLEKLPPALPINERDLSDLLGVSRTPIREAIRQLALEGLVEYSETRRPCVADPTLETITEWLLIQAALEGLAGEQACRSASDDELSSIQRKFEEMVEQASVDEPLQRFNLDMDFHRLIVAAAHMPALVETHEQYNARLWRARFLSTTRPTNRREQAMRHKSILDPLLARDAAATARALREHLGNAPMNIYRAQRARDADIQAKKGAGGEPANSTPDAQRASNRGIARTSRAGHHRG